MATPQLPPLKLGVSLWSQGTTWPAMLEAAHQIDQAGYEYLFTQDHLYATFGDWHQPIFEGWTLLGALAQATRRVNVGLLVTANTLRHPALTAKMAVTIDHISGGRAILGLGAGWFEPEHEAHGIEFGSGVGERLSWLQESTAAIRSLLRGECLDSAGPRYQFKHATHAPRPFGGSLPVLIGGAGEQRTLRIAALYADIWNASGTPEVMGRKSALLDAYCAAIGREPSSIERSVTCKMVIRADRSKARRVWEATLAGNQTAVDVEPDPWLGPPQLIADRIARYREVGVTSVVVSVPHPYDAETIRRLRDDVLPLVAEISGTPAEPAAMADYR